MPKHSSGALKKGNLVTWGRPHFPTSRETVWNCRNGQKWSEKIRNSGWNRLKRTLALGAGVGAIIDFCHISASINRNRWISAHIARIYRYLPIFTDITDIYTDIYRYLPIFLPIFTDIYRYFRYLSIYMVGGDLSVQNCINASPRLFGVVKAFIKVSLEVYFLTFSFQCIDEISVFFEFLIDNWIFVFVFVFCK